MIEIRWHPTSRELRFFAVLQTVVWAAGAWLLDRHGPSPLLALAILAVGLLVAGVGLVIPRLMRPFYLAWMLVAFPLGWTISHILLVGVYYLLCTPIGLIRRLCGRDPMRRRFEPSSASYWLARTPNNNTDRYLRQF